MPEKKTPAKKIDVATKDDIKRLEKKLESHDDNFNSINKRFEDIDKRFESIDKRFETVENDIEVLKKGQNELLRLYFRLEDKIDANQEQINARFDQLFNLFDKYTKKISDLETEKISTTARLDRHNNQISEHEKRIIKLESAK